MMLAIVVLIRISKASLSDGNFSIMMAIVILIWIRISKASLSEGKLPIIIDDGSGNDDKYSQMMKQGSFALLLSSTNHHQPSSTIEFDHYQILNSTQVEFLPGIHFSHYYVQVLIFKILHISLTTSCESL